MRGKSAEIPSEILPQDSAPLVFLVGAGISLDRPSSLPTARLFMKPVLATLTTRNVADRFYPKKGAAPIVTPEPRFEFTCQLIKEYLDSDLSLGLLSCYSTGLRENAARPNFAHLALSDFLLRGDYVFTTNFDHLLEDALRERGKNGSAGIRAYFTTHDYRQLHELLVRGGSLPKGVYKLHGSLEDPKTLGVTFDNVRYERHKEAVFRWALERCHLYVMGYSGSDEFDVLPMMGGAPATTHRLVWVVRRPRGSSVELFGGRSGRPFKEFVPASDTEQAVGERLERFIRLRRRSPENVLLVVGPTRQILREVYCAMFGDRMPELQERYEIAEKGETPAEEWRLRSLIDQYAQGWAKKKVVSQPLEARLAAVEFMWMQNVPTLYRWACRELRNVADKEKNDRRSIARAIADKYEAWACWFRGDYRRMRKLAVQSVGALRNWREVWQGYASENKVIGQAALEALVDGYQCWFEAHSLLGDRAKAARVAEETMRIKLRRPSHRVKKAWADMFHVRANMAYSVGNLCEGRELYSKALRQYAAIGERQWVAYSRGGIADYFRVSGEYDRALVEYRKGFEPIRILGGTWLAAWYKMAILDIQRFYPERNLTGEWTADASPDQMLVAANTLVTEIERAVDRQTLGLAYRWRGDLARQRGNLTCAERDYQRSEACFRREETPAGEYATRLCQLVLRLQESQNDSAEMARVARDIERFKTACASQHLQLEAAHCELILAEVDRVSQGRSSRFVSCFERYRELNCKWGQLMSVVGLELGKRGNREVSLTSEQIVEEHKLRWARRWLKRFKTKVRLEFYLPLFN